MLPPQARPMPAAPVGMAPPQRVMQPQVPAGQVDPRAAAAQAQMGVCPAGAMGVNRGEVGMPWAQRFQR